MTSAAHATRAKTMRAAVFRKPGQIKLEERPIPSVGPNDALIRITLTTICGTDVHIYDWDAWAAGRGAGSERGRALPSCWRRSPPWRPRPGR